MAVGAAITVSLVVTAALAASSRPPDRGALERMCREVSAAALVDADTGQPLFLYEADAVLPPASTVKLMLLLVASEELARSGRGPADSIRISRRARATGGQQLYLEEGERYSIETLALATAVHSANDAAVALAEGLFGSYERAVSRMNARASELGLGATRFRTPHGLPAGWGQKGDRSTAHDLARLARAASADTMVARWCAVQRTPFPGRDLILINTNTLLRDGDHVTGLKTGFTQRARYCFIGSAERDGRRLVCAILGSPSSRARFRLASALFAFGFDRCRRRLVLPAGVEVATRTVIGGADVTEVAVAPRDSLWLWQDEDDATPPQVFVAVSDSLTAPLSEGEVVGEVRLYVGNHLSGRTSAQVARSVAEVSGWRRFLDHFVDRSPPEAKGP